MDVGWSPSVWMVTPRIGTRLDGGELITAFFIGDELAFADKIRIKRRIVLIDRMPITPGRICLPDFHQRVPDSFAILI
jgi:hypothetical protein